MFVSSIHVQSFMKNCICCNEKQKKRSKTAIFEGKQKRYSKVAIFEKKFTSYNIVIFHQNLQIPK